MFAENGWLLRSGAAVGADSAFEKGCDMVGGAKEIFLPKKGHNGNQSPFYHAPELAFQILDDLFPSARGRAPYIRDLLARNMQQVFGPELDDPVDLVICWMPTVVPKGGTRYAVIAAEKFDIPTINLLHQETEVMLYL